MRPRYASLLGPFVRSQGAPPVRRANPEPHSCPRGGQRFMPRGPPCLVGLAPERAEVHSQGRLAPGRANAEPDSHPGGGGGLRPAGRHALSDWPRTGRRSIARGAPPLVGCDAPKSDPAPDGAEVYNPWITMPQSFACLHYHLIFSTKDRAPLLVGDHPDQLHAYSAASSETRMELSWPPEVCRTMFTCWSL